MTLKLPLLLLISTIMATTTSAQTLTIDELFRTPSDQLSSPELPHVTTAGMFLKTCLAGTSPYYSGHIFTYIYRTANPPLIEEIDPQTSPFISIFSEEHWEINGEHVSSFLLRPDYGEYLLYVRSYDGDQFLETCLIATNTMSQIKLLLDAQKTFPEMGYSLGEIQEAGGNVQFWTALDALKDYAVKLDYGVRLGETNGYSWIATQRSF